MCPRTEMYPIVGLLGRTSGCIYSIGRLDGDLISPNLFELVPSVSNSFPLSKFSRPFHFSYTSVLMSSFRERILIVLIFY